MSSPMTNSETPHPEPVMESAFEGWLTEMAARAGNSVYTYRSMLHAAFWGGWIARDNHVSEQGRHTRGFSP